MAAEDDDVGTTAPGEADIVAVDRNGATVLVVEANAQEPTAASQQQLAANLALANPAPPYGMLVGPSHIVLFSWDGKTLAEVSRMESAAVLSEYDTSFGRKRVFEDHLVNLTEAWLRDVAFHWKSPSPPAYDHLKAVGLADRLAGGSTRTEVRLGRAALR